MPTYRPRYRSRPTACFVRFMAVPARACPTSPSPDIIARQPARRWSWLPLCRFMTTTSKNAQKPPLNRAPGQNVPTYQPTITVRPMGHSVRSTAIHVRATAATIYRTTTHILACPKPAKIGMTNFLKR